MHPRDKNGQFIEKQSVVNVDGKRRGKVINIAKSGVLVNFEDRSTEIISDMNRIEVPPDPKASLKAFKLAPPKKVKLTEPDKASLRRRVHYDEYGDKDNF